MELKKQIKEYFSFTLKERIGIVVLIFLVFVVFILPGLIRQNNNLPGVAQQGISAFTKTSNKDQSLKENYSGNNENNSYENYRKDVSSKRSAELFNFNPNTASKEEWERLGVREKTVRTILNYLSKGGHFYKPEDLKKIYGLHEELVERLIPFVRLPERYSQKRFSGNEKFEKLEQQNFKREYYKSPGRKRMEAIDINRADSVEFESLPGIGSKLAGRIIRFREKLGGFYSIEQVGETYGLSDSTFKRILPMLMMPEAQIKLININKSDIYVLKAHPYIGWQVANLLVRYRQQHGEFKSVETIREIGGLSPERAIKLVPYLSID